MQKRCLLAFVAFMSFLGMLQAQTLVTGTIMNADGEPVSGASVAAKSIQIGALSDATGKFSLSLPGEGTALLTIYALGYATQEEEVLLDGKLHTLDITLAEDVFLLDQVVVTGTNTSRTQKEMIASLTQVSSKQLQAINPNSMADIMRFIPGVHAEGGGGDVAANIFVRGLPAGGQYKYNPIEEDGMPVQSTGYLTSSAQDVFFRNDLGVAAMEFARGGSSTLFGMGAPLGVFNYISKKGGGEGETIVRLSGGQYNLLRMDFNQGGSVGANWQYNVSGFVRYDEGPLVTGSASRGYQIRGNITRNFEKGYARLYIRTLDDNAQFFLPFPHVKNSIDAATGNDGNPITTLNTPYGGVFSLVNPNGTINGNVGDGVTAKGNSVMFEYVRSFGKWDLKSKTRLSRFDHRFDFWAPGKTYEIEAYARLKNPALASYTYTYANNGQPMTRSSGANGGKTYVTEESITLRNRPMTDQSTDLRMTRKLIGASSEHNITIGTFGAITRQLQDEVGTGVLVEFADQPRLVNLSIVDTTGKTTQVTRAGFRQNVAGRTYNTFEADRLALYVGDEMVFGRLRVDAGLRYEIQQGVINVSETAAYTNSSASSLADASYRWLTGRVTYRKVHFQDYSFVIGGNYKLSKAANLYGSFTKGYYFPELRTFSNISRDQKGEFIQQVPEKNERVYQAEAGIKYGTSKLSGTLAVYYNTIKDRLQNDIIAGTDGVLREITNAVGSTSTIGTEVSVAYQVVNGFIVDVNATIQDHQYDEFVKTLPGPDNVFGTADDVKQDYQGNWVLRQPKAMINGGLSYNKHSWDLGLMYNYVGKRFADDQNNIELPGYSLINLRAARELQLDDTGTMTIGLNLYNAFNSRGLTEGDPRVADTNTVANDPFYNARPILPRRLTAAVTFSF